MWLEKTVPVFQEIMHEYDKEKGVQKIIDEMTDNDKLSKDYTIDNFRAQIQVDYDPDSDNIQYFADYLMDLDDTKHSELIFADKVILYEGDSERLYIRKVPIEIIKFMRIWKMLYPL